VLLLLDEDRSPSLPMSGSDATCPTKYAVTTHEMRDTPPMSRAMLGSAVATIVPSIVLRIIPS
jgi:hypothetical protein